MIWRDELINEVARNPDFETVCILRFDAMKFLYSFNVDTFLISRWNQIDEINFSNKNFITDIKIFTI